MRKPKTPLMSFLHRCLEKASIADARGEDFLAELEEKKSAERYDRREFLARSLGGVAAGGLLLSLVPEANAAVLPEIAIIGGGIAGLNAALCLSDAGIRSNVKIYEGSSGNSWGRIQTHSMGGNIHAEFGGEFIDTDHAEMFSLVKKFGLKFVNTQEQTASLDGDSYFFRGRYYSETEVRKEFRKISAQIARDNKAYDNENAKRTAELDETSVKQYLENLKATYKYEDWFYDLLNTAYTSEFGMEIGEQSSLNFITMIGTDPAKFKIFGDSDELYKIEGGNSTLIEAMKNKLEGRIETNRRLEAIKRDKTGKYHLSFAGRREETADRLVLALPFTQLRNVDIQKGLFTPEKMTAINELGYGASSKLLLPTTSRIWRDQYRSGYLFNETIQNGWDYSLGQENNTGRGGYTVFLGGNAARSLDRGETNRYVRELNRAFRGFERVRDGDSKVINWAKDEWVSGGYACYKTGQWTTISGEEITPQRNSVFFCGEHCSSDYQGYMNGGAETGRAAAASLVKSLKKPAMRKSGRNRR
jgi:monoamine oxidase